MERKRSQRAAEGRAGEAGDRGAIEAGDDPDDSGNSEALANGELEKSKQQAVFAQQDQAKGFVKVNSYGLTPGFGLIHCQPHQEGRRGFKRGNVVDGGDG